MFLIVVGVQLWVDRSTPVTVTIAPGRAQDIRVSVSGAVATPGLVNVPEGARLSDVVDAAGGFVIDADYTNLNLAGRVGDGEHVVIPVRVGDGADSTTNSMSDGLLDINTANEAQLVQLPGIGEVIASRIVEYRTLHGPLTSVDELVQINGVSERLLEELRPYITVSDGT